MSEAGSAQERQAQIRDRLLRSAPLAVGLSAFGLGLVNLTGPPRSYDERITIATASRSVTDIWHAARSTEAPHLLYYLLMKPWLALAGTSDWAARFPSVVAGGVAAGFLTAVGTRLFGRAAGIVAGVTLATAAFVVHFSQWARGYAPAFALTVIGSYAFVRAIREPRTSWVVLWAVSLAAACWLNLFAVSVLAAYVAAYLFVPSRPDPRLAAIGALIVTSTVTPLVVLVGTADNGQLSWIPSLTLRHVAVQTWNWSSRNPVVLLAAAVGAVALAVARTRRANWKGAFVVVWTLAPFVLTLVLSAFQPAFDEHYLLTGTAGLALLVGIGVTALPGRAGILLAAALAVGAGLQLAHYYLEPGRPFTQLF